MMLQCTASAPASFLGIGIGVQECVHSALGADRRDRPMSGIDPGFVGQAEEILADVSDQMSMCAVMEVGPADAAIEQSVADDHEPGCRAMEAAAARRVP